MNIESSTALVTGGAVRIGRAICLALAARNCGIVVHYDRSGEDAKTLVEQLGREGIRATSVQGNLSSQADCDRVVDTACAQAGGISILINNAAVFQKHSLLASGEEQILQDLRVNAVVPILLTRAFALKLGVSTGRGNYPSAVKGKVINLLDRRIAGNEPGCLSYLLSKKMLADFTKNAALELAPAITVNGVAPGAVLAPPQARNTPDDTVAPVHDSAGPIPLQRRCTPEDVAAAVIFLIESDGITGQTIFVDGGQHLVGAVNAIE